MPKIQECKQGNFIYLPKEYMQLLSWGKGDVITCYPDSQNKQTLILRKVVDAKDIQKNKPAPIINAPTPRPQGLLWENKIPRPVQRIHF
jgi:hypothetical protein